MNHFRNIGRSLPAMLIAVGSLAGAGLAQGLYTPDLVKDGNRWTLTFFDDSSPAHNQWATQGLCFRYAGIVGTHQRYYWWSDTYPDWNGLATQEGDEVTMHGDYAKDVGHDGMKWDIVTMSPRNQGAGHWWEWRENGGFGNTIGWGNARLERVGACRYTYTDALHIKLPTDDDGREMATPMGNIPEVTPQPEPDLK